MFARINYDKLIILDPLICNMIRLFKINYVRFFYEYDLDGKLILIGKSPNDDELSLNKSWIKINIKKIIYIRTPTILKSYIDKIISYDFEQVFTEKNEVMRIRPVNFDFNIKSLSNFKNMKREPYFTKDNIFIIPKIFIRNSCFNKKILISKISFDKTTDKLINDGYIFVNIVEQPQIGNTSFSFKIKKFELVTEKLKKLKSIAYKYGKSLNNFEFISLIKENDNDKYGTMVFMEENNARQN